MLPRRALGALTVLAFGLLAGLVAVPPPAQAAAPPTTTPDAVTVLQGNFVAVFPIKNDVDPDNDLVTVCRLGTETYPGIDVSFLGDEVDFTVSEKVAPGTYTFTYYACDFQTLVPGAITLTVEDLPDIKVKKVGRGKLKVTNPFPYRIRFSYGSFKQGRPDGQVKIPAGAKVTVPVERRKIDWFADARKGTVFCGSGHVKGIDLRAAARPEPMGARWPAAR